MNVSKAKELIADFRRTQHQRTYSPLGIDGTAVERVSSFRYLGVHIAEDLNWNTHIDTLVRKVNQCLCQLRQLRKFRVSWRILQAFNTGAVESILTGSITAWFGKSSSQDRRAPQRVVGSAERTPHPAGPVLQDVSNQSLQDHEGSSQPQQQTVPSDAARQAPPQSRC